MMEKAESQESLLSDSVRCAQEQVLSTEAKELVEFASSRLVGCVDGGREGGREGKGVEGEGEEGGWKRGRRREGRRGRKSEGVEGEGRKGGGEREEKGRGRSKRGREGKGEEGGRKRGGGRSRRGEEECGVLLSTLLYAHCILMYAELCVQCTLILM